MCGISSRQRRGTSAYGVIADANNLDGHSARVSAEKYRPPSADDGGETAESAARPFFAADFAAALSAAAAAR